MFEKYITKIKTFYLNKKLTKKEQLKYSRSLLNMPIYCKDL